MRKALLPPENPNLLALCLFLFSKSRRRTNTKHPKRKRTTNIIPCKIPSPPLFLHLSIVAVPFGASVAALVLCFVPPPDRRPAEENRGPQGVTTGGQSNGIISESSSSPLGHFEFMCVYAGELSSSSRTVKCTDTFAHGIQVLRGCLPPTHPPPITQPHSNMTTIHPSTSSHPLIQWPPHQVN